MEKTRHTKNINPPFSKSNKRKANRKIDTQNKAIEKMNYQEIKKEYDFKMQTGNA